MNLTALTTYGGYTIHREKKKRLESKIIRKKSKIEKHYMEIEDFMKTAEDWITGFLEYSSLFEYQVTEEEKKRTLASFREHMQNYIDLEIMKDGCGELTYEKADC